MLDTGIGRLPSRVGRELTVEQHILLRRQGVTLPLPLPIPDRSGWSRLP